MGVIAAQTKMPSCKFANPANGATVKAFTDFIIQMKINNVRTFMLLLAISLTTDFIRTARYG